MLKQNEIKRLKNLKLSDRAIARAVKCSRKSVRKYLSNQNLVAPPRAVPEWVGKLDWANINVEHELKGVPLNVLWEEGQENKTIPVTYSVFWKHYKKRFPKHPVTMVRPFEPGSRIEIDYCDGIDIADPITGEMIKTHLFVGVLCSSRYTYAEFTFSQKSHDFLSSHVRMFEFFGGVAQTLAPDNLKSAVTKAHKYDPDINPAYTKLAEHYDIAVTPARVRSPKDKAIVERNIQIFQRWFYYRVRHRIFTSIVELNHCLKEYLKIFNNKIHRIFKKSRSEMFQEEKRTLKCLPEVRYEVRTHKKATLHHDCHLQFDNNYYSAPWKLRGKKLDVWATEKTVEVFFNGDCIAIHNRSINRGKFVTDKQHYPVRHQAYLELTPSYLREKAEKMGKKVSEVIEVLMSGKHPLRYLRRAQGIIALSKKYTCVEVNMGCSLALQYEKYHLKFIENIIKNYRANELTKDRPIKRTSNPHLRGQSTYH